MGLLARLFGRETKESASVTSSLDLFREIYGSRATASGETVTWKTALDVPTVLACCRVIANGIAQVPWRLYQKVGDGRQAADDLPLANVIASAPNGWQTSYEYRETLAFHVLLTGNHFSFINRVGSAREVRELIPIQPHLVTVEQLDNYRVEYRVRREQTGAERVFPQEAVWHVRGPSWNSWMGLEAVRLAREAIGLAMAIERGQAQFHKNGMQTSGAFSIEPALSPERYVLLRKYMDEAMKDRGRPLILDQGAKYLPFSMTGVDAQLLETRNHQIEEICREFGVMPIMIGHSDKAATYASAEQMFLAHVVHTLAPWYERLEQSANVALLSPQQRLDGYYTKFTPNALMRGAAADRASFYTAALGTTQQPGWMTANEVRALEDMDPIDGGDELTPLITQAPSTAPPQGDANGTA